MEQTHLVVRLAFLTPRLSNPMHCSAYIKSIPVYLQPTRPALPWLPVGVVRCL